jgi:AraC family transcriptional regulator
MNWLEGFNQVVEYIEEHLENEINYDEIADIFGYSVYHVQRLFAMVAGVPLSEYIRNRRLAKAAMELQGSECKVIDIALKYGYSSPNSFNRAFKAFHGVAPSDVKKECVKIKAYPPFCFELTVKGGQEMEYHIVNKNKFRIVGIKMQTTLANNACYKDTPLFWKTVIQSGRHNDILALMNQEPFGLLGVSNYSPDFSSGIFNYYIACSTDQPVPEGMEEFIVPESTWAVFSSKAKETDAIQNLEQRIVMEWLPTSGYEFGKAPDIEIYDEEGYVDIWVPIKKKN